MSRIDPRVAFVVLSYAFTACLDAAPEVAAQEQSLLKPSQHAGQLLFERALPGTNGRACATCHVLSEATTLRPASVVERLRTQPDDPLFNPLDADDPNAAALGFEHLKKGLVRVVLHLADNLDVI